MKIRNPKNDKIKSNSQQRLIFEQKLKCIHEDCGDLLTIFKGPGDNSLCRHHQRNLHDYGGYGRLDRPHTFHRTDICQCCKQDINNDPRWEIAQEYFSVFLTEKQKNEIKRRYNHGDHNTPRADGGSDLKENANAFCSFCHWVKTVIFNDGRKKIFLEDV